MRLKRNRLREFKHFQVVQKKDAEGGTYTEYAPPSCFRAEMWTAGGKVQAEMYGSRLPVSVPAADILSVVVPTVLSLYKNLRCVVITPFSLVMS